MNISIGHGITPALVPVGDMANAMFVCDNACGEDPIGSITFGSRRFNISLEISMAEILWWLIQLCNQLLTDED